MSSPPPTDRTRSRSRRRLPSGAFDRQALAARHLGMVKAQALQLRRHLPAGFELDDLVSFGTQGLMEASERYDPSRGLAFSTYAHYRIRGAIFDGLRSLGPLPRWAVTGLRAAEGTDDYLENAAARRAGATPRAGGDPRAAPPRPRPRPSTAQTLQTLSGHVAGIATIVLTSLEAHEGEDPRVADGRAEQAFERLDGMWRSQLVREALLELPAEERRLIQLCYYQGKTLKEAGREHGRSRSWASRLHVRAINRLREILGTAPPDPPG